MFEEVFFWVLRMAHSLMFLMMLMYMFFGDQGRLQAAKDFETSSVISGIFWICGSHAFQMHNARKNN